MSKGGPGREERKRVMSDWDCLTRMKLVSQNNNNRGEGDSKEVEGNRGGL